MIVFTAFFILTIIICIVGCCTDIKKCFDGEGCCIICMSPSSKDSASVASSSQRDSGSFAYSRSGRRRPQQSPTTIRIIHNQS